jgi:hypothetical protein
MLGDQDLEPRTKPLSDSEKARQQGPNVYPRGLLLYQSAEEYSQREKTSFAWNLHIVEGVAYDSSSMAPQAIPYLFDLHDSDRAAR